MTNEEKIEIKKLSLDDVNSIVTAILDSLFLKDDEGENINYTGQYSEVVRAYIEMVLAIPDLKLHDVDLVEFFGRYCDGEFDEYLELMRKDRRIQYIERAVEDGIQMRLRYYNGGMLHRSVARLINNLSDVVEQYSDSIDGLESDDLKGFVQSFTEFAGKTDTDSLVSAILNKKKSAAKPRKTTKSAKTENKAE